MRSLAITIILFCGFISGIAIISFSAGAWLTYNKGLPYSTIYRINLALSALEVVDTDPDDKKLPVDALFRWNVTHHVPDATTDGLTLVCSARHPSAHLLDMKGQVVHSWWLRPDQHKLILHRRIEDTYLFPNGDLLASYVIHGSGSDERKLVKLNKDSQVLWEYDGFVHHEVSVDEHGRIYALIDPVSETTFDGIRHFFNAPFLHDQIAILSPDGKEHKRLSIIKAFVRTQYGYFLHSINAQNRKGDFTHNNSVEILGSNLANAFPMFEPGYLLVSLRNINTIGVIDPNTEKVVWAARGPWRWQHDPDFMPNGNIRLFDNLGTFKYSRILEIDVPTGEIVNSWGPKEGLNFYTPIRGKHQQLSNGNMLIAAGSNNKILEWNEDKGVVWEMHNPQFNTITCTDRYEREELTFL